MVVPLFTPSRLPLTSDNRWASWSSARLGQVADFFGAWPLVENQGRRLPGDRLENAQYGFKLSSSTLAPGWDLALCFYRGLYPSGVFENTIIPPGPDSPAPLVRSRRVFPVFNETGASFATTAGDWEWHGEVAYHWTQDRDKDEDYFEYVLGLNYTYPDASALSLQEAIFILEYAGVSVTRQRPSHSLYTDAGYGRGLKNSLQATLKLEFSQDSSLEVVGAYTFDDRDWFCAIGFQHKLSDQVTGELGFQGFAGPEDSFFGQWRDNDRFYLQFTYYI